MKTEKINGFFDVRKYDKKVERKDRKMIGENENFTFNASFPINELPALFMMGGTPDEFVKLYTSRSEAQAAEAEGREARHDRASVKFKIGSGCKWFDKFGRACDKPSNEELDGNHYEVMIDFKRKAKNPSDDKAPSGYWVNAIMFRKVDDNPFAGQAFEESADEPEQEAMAPKPAQEAAAEEGAAPKLPF